MVRVDGPVDGRQILRGEYATPDLQSPFVYFAKFTNLRKGDALRLSIIGPDGLFARNQTEPLDRPKSTFTAYVVNKTRPSRAPISARPN